MKTRNQTTMKTRNHKRAVRRAGAGVGVATPASVVKTPLRGFQRPKRGVSAGLSDAEKLPATHSAYKLAAALLDAGLLAYDAGRGNDDAQLQKAARIILETAKACGERERVPCLRFDFGFVGHGYQCDVFVNGKEAGGECRDFSGTYAVSYVKDEFRKVILKAIEGVRGKL